MRKLGPRLFYVAVAAVAVAVGATIVVRYDASTVVADGDNPVTVTTGTDPAPPSTSTTVDPHDVIEVAAAHQRNEAWTFVGAWATAEATDRFLLAWQTAERDAYNARVAAEANRARTVTVNRPGAAAGKPVPAASRSGGSPSGGCAIPSYICQRESGGNPNAYNPTGCGGRGCYGRYQFDPRTWDAAARAAGRSDLVGNYHASGSDQDQVAAHLWAGGRGCSHWNAC